MTVMKAIDGLLHNVPRTHAHVQRLLLASLAFFSASSSFFSSSSSSGCQDAACSWCITLLVYV